MHDPKRRARFLLSGVAAIASAVASGLTGCRDLGGLAAPDGTDAMVNASDAAKAEDGADASNMFDRNAVDAPTSDLSDHDAATFGAGTFLDTRWDGDHVALALGKARGDFVSRVFDARTSRPWLDISWMPGAPYAKRLPNSRAAESGYRRDMIAMRENVWLLHFDDTFADDSGRGQATQMGSLSGSSTTVFVPGRFANGFLDTLDTWAYTVIEPGGDLATNMDDFTWALWVSSTQDCTQNIVYLGTEDPSDSRPHLWLGCTSTFTNCPNLNGTGRLTGWAVTASSDGGMADNGFCGQRVVNDGKWHHIAMVKSGHSPALVTGFVDGVPDGSFTSYFQQPVTFDTRPQLALGAFEGGSARYQSSGTFDDVAVWRRALSDAEVAALFRRGGLRLTFQVRVCATETCTDNPAFVGPGADSARHFAETLWLSPPVVVSLDGMPEGRYAQYRAHFESDDPSSSPELYTLALR